MNDRKYKELKSKQNRFVNSYNLLVDKKRKTKRIRDTMKGLYIEIAKIEITLQNEIH